MKPCTLPLVPAQTASESGFVLVSVIWLVALVALLAAAAAVAVRLQVKSTANIIEAARAEALADGTARLVAFELAVHEGGSGYDVAGRPRRCALTEDFAARIAVQDQRGLIDLNGASRELLESFLAAAGFDGRRAGRLAAAVVDFRDEDHTPLPEGGEEDDYRQAGLGHGPKNAAFQAAEELDQVLGFEAGEIGRLLPHLTVYSQQSGPDPALAPEPLRAMLRMPGRREAPGDAAETPGERAGRTYAVDVTVERGSSGAFRRRAVVLIAGRPERPFAVLDWRQGVGPLTQGERQDAQAGAPCFGKLLFPLPVSSGP
jgi:general secretion pathway protein K